MSGMWRPREERRRRAFVAFFALIALGWVVAAAVTFGSGRYGAGFFCLAVGIIFCLFAWLLTAHSRQVIPASWDRRALDGLNWIFFRLHLDWAVNPEWNDRTGHHRPSKN